MSCDRGSYNDECGKVHGMIGRRDLMRIFNRLLWLRASISRQEFGMGIHYAPVYP